MEDLGVVVLFNSCFGVFQVTYSVKKELSQQSAIFAVGHITVRKVIQISAIEHGIGEEKKDHIKYSA